jgi:hypothetical protein
MGGGKPPAPESPSSVIHQQSQANTKALGESEAANQVDKTNPSGEQSWRLLGYDQNGNPQYGMSEQYTPEQQALYNFMQGSQNFSGFAGNNLIGNLVGSGNYNQAFDPTAAVGDATSGRLGQMVQYLDPYFSKQIQQDDSTMRNQGLVPGDEAYDEQMRQEKDTQNQSIQSLLAQFQPQAFQQAYQQHQEPIQEAQAFSQFGAPNPLSFSPTPQYAQNAVNVSQIYDQNYKAQLAAYQQQQMQRSGMLQGLGAIGGAILGGPVGSSIGSGIAGMFGSGNQQLPWQVAGQGN